MTGTYLLNKFENDQLAQESIDTMYTELCKSIYSEMDKFLKCNSTERTKTRKQLRLSKPYWNEELTNKWMTIKNFEKIYLKCINVNQRKYNRQCYLKSRREFDKYLRLCERKYRNETVDKIDKLNDNDSREFWNQIQNLGIRKKNIIPMEIKTNDGVVTSDKQSVLNHGKDEFSKLYNIDVSEDHEDREQEEFSHTMYDHKQQLETVHRGNFNVYLNEDITFQEVLYAVKKVKLKKSSGINNIPNEVLKQPSIITLMHILFNYCFKNSIVPSAWLKGIIVPVPEGCL